MSSKNTIIFKYNFVASNKTGKPLKLGNIEGKIESDKPKSTVIEVSFRLDNACKKC